MQQARTEPLFIFDAISSLVAEVLLRVDILPLRYAVERDAGRFRSERVLITGTHFVPPGGHKFAELIPKMLELANRSGVHPVIQSAELHYNVVAIHPFGNGRSARLMMNFLLLHLGYPHVIIDVAASNTWRCLTKPTRVDGSALPSSSHRARNARFKNYSANNVPRPGRKAARMATALLQLCFFRNSSAVCKMLAG